MFALLSFKEYSKKNDVQSTEYFDKGSDIIIINSQVCSTHFAPGCIILIFTRPQKQTYS